MYRLGGLDWCRRHPTGSVGDCGLPGRQRLEGGYLTTDSGTGEIDVAGHVKARLGRRLSASVGCFLQVTADVPKQIVRGDLPITVQVRLSRVQTFDDRSGELRGLVRISGECLFPVL